MGASRFIGRVGGLAVALGAGAAWFAVGVASADTASASPSGAGERSHAKGVDSATSRSVAAPKPNRQIRTTPRAAAADIVEVQRTSSPIAADRKPAAAIPRIAPTAVVVEATPSATPVAQRDAPDAEAAPVSVPQAVVADSPPAGHLPAGTLPAGTRRQPAAAAAITPTTQVGQTAQAICDFCVDPSVAWGGTFNGKTYDGVLVGTLGATSSLPLTYTAISSPSQGGKLASANGATPSNTIVSPAGEFFYLPYATALSTPGATESFRILVAQQTGFTTFLANIPIVGLIAPTVIELLHRTPFLSDLLAPLIGASEVVTFTVGANALAADRPTAFTVKVPSFDGLMVSLNYFPATNVAQGLVESAPTVLNGPGLGSPGNTDAANPYGQIQLLPGTIVPTPAADQFGSLTPGLPVLRDGAWTPENGPSYTGSTGYNVITWDPRGEFATRDRSLPGLQIDNPFFEARDASALISWATSAANPARSQVALEDPVTGDPLLGMVGGSYGGGIQWTTAGTDSRVDAIVPQISWNSLISSLYPNDNQFKTGFGTVLLLALVTTGAHINSQIYQGIATGFALGWLSQTSQAMLSSAGPTVLVNNIAVPTLIFQGMQDVLFELDESVANAQMLLANGVATKMVWFCGGHGTCNDPLNTFQDDRGLVDNLKWLEQYVAGNGTPTDDIPNFQWYDQLGFYYTSDLLPFQDGFNLPDPYTETGTGGLLGLGPIIGGSGPGGVSGVSPVLTIGNASAAWNAINLTVTPPPSSQIVGSPTLSFSYSGLGTSRTVYAQLVDNETGQVLGNLVTPVPVVLDGRARTATIPLANIGYTTQNQGLTLQITSSASNFENFTTAGVINIGDITLDLPIRADS